MLSMKSTIVAKAPHSCVRTTHHTSAIAWANKTSRSSLLRMTTAKTMADDASKEARKLEKANAKAARKLAKLQAKAAASGGSDDTAVAVAADVAAEKKKDKKERKKEKKEKKRARGEQQEEQEVAAVEPDSPAPPKKAKAAAPAAHAAPTAALAAVGDKALAAKGPPIVRALYTESPEVAALSAAAVDALRAERRTAVSVDVRPVQTFAQTGLPPAMLHAVRDFSAPSPIQAQCWPLVLGGYDLVGIAATGSGKTLGFGLPMLAHIDAQRKARGGAGSNAAATAKGRAPLAAVIAPTRELAVQIAEVLSDAGSRCGVTVACVYGGVPKGPQTAALRAGVDVVVATPGRLEDLMQDGAARLGGVTYLVLDEADRMLDLGFEPHIRAICATVRADRQTLMFSATWPSEVQQLAANFLGGAPARVTIGSAELAASHSVSQAVEVIDPAARDARLVQLLQKGGYGHKGAGRVIVFVLYKKEAPRVEALLARRGLAAAAVHGDASQAARSGAVDAFKAGTTPILVATDVAARGLDIPDVELVLNYSFPLTIEDYVHRIGRTGRAGKTGAAHTFFCAAADKARAGELINVLKEAGQPVPDALLAFGTTVKKKEHKLYGAHFKDVDMSKKATKITFD